MNWRQQVTHDKVFERCTWQHCTLAESTFDGCTFRDCTFVDCACRLLKVPKSRFSNLTFNKCDLSYIDWTRGIWPKTASRAVSFSGSNLDYSTFTALSLKKLVMTDCTAHFVDFAEADLTQARCIGTDFADSRFHGTNLTEVDFSRAANYAISPLTNKIKGATFSLPQVLALLATFEIVIADYPPNIKSD